MVAQGLPQRVPPAHILAQVQVPLQAQPQAQGQGEDPDMVRAERDSLRTEIARLQEEVQLQRARADSTQEALVALQARVDAGDFANMEVHTDAEELEELARLRGEVATLRAERATHQTQIDEYRRQWDIARQMVEPGASVIVMQEAISARRSEAQAVQEAAYYRSLYHDAVPADQR